MENTLKVLLQAAVMIRIPDPGSLNSGIQMVTSVEDKKFNILVLVCFFVIFTIHIPHLSGIQIIHVVYIVILQFDRTS